MNKAAFVAFALSLGLAGSGAAQAGCLTGAVVGGVAGHYAGHHPILGAVGGCAVGHHLAVMKHRRLVAQRQAAMAQH